MAVNVTDVKALHEYAEGVMSRADHHADQVKGIVLALLGAIVWRGDPGTLEAKQYGGNLANILWVEINGNRYAFAYNHKTYKIEMRDRKQSGPMLHEFDNNTPVKDIEAIFRAL